MAKTHWKALTDQQYLGAYAIQDEDLILTIKSVKKETFVGNGGKTDEGIVIRFEEPGVKNMICNSTNAKTIQKVVGSPYIEEWAGHKIALYSAEVSAFGETVDALRVRPYAPKVEIYCEACGQVIKAANGYSPKAIAASSKKKFGRCLCWDCAQAKKDEGDTDAE